MVGCEVMMRLTGRMDIVGYSDTRLLGCSAARRRLAVCAVWLFAPFGCFLRWVVCAVRLFAPFGCLRRSAVCAVRLVTYVRAVVPNSQEQESHSRSRRHCLGSRRRVELLEQQLEMRLHSVRR